MTIVVTDGDRGTCVKLAIRLAVYAHRMGAGPVDVPAPLRNRLGGWCIWLELAKEIPLPGTKVSLPRSLGSNAA